MVFLRALLFSVGIFVGLTVIALLVAVIMRIIYSVVHKSNKSGNRPQPVEGKAG